MIHLYPNLSLLPPALALVVIAAFIAARYVLFAGGALALIAAFARRFAHRRIQPIGFTRGQLARELGFSLLSAFVFAAFALVSATWAREAGLSKVYTDPAAHGWLWLVVSLPVVILIHDLYFYLTHRLIHLPGVFERVHRVHHLSTNPSPLAVLAFHPLEAIVQAGVIVVVTWLLPVHVAVLAAWSFATLAINVMGHLGYEVLPAGWSSSRWLSWINTATSHNQHHRTFRHNYGLYTLIWDRLFGTLHPAYARLYDQVTTRLREAKP